MTTPYWTLDANALVGQLRSSPEGLSREEALARRRAARPVRPAPSRVRARVRLLARQLRSPLVMLLVFAAVASATTRAWMDGAIVLAIVVVSAVVGYSRESSAQSVVDALRARIRTQVTALRDGRATRVPLEEIVPGDVVLLAAGSLVPGDGVILAASDFFVSEGGLTGESFPVEKRAGAAPASASIHERRNCVFLGTNVRSGTARCLIVETGSATEYGAIARHLEASPPETAFDRGLRHFGYLLTSAMLVMVVLVFVAHVIRGRPPIETLLFSVALAVGLSPELLPVILNVNLARGARTMADAGVLVRRLNAIENLGSMDVLCSDKTGTLTEGVVRVEGTYDASGAASSHVLQLAALNAALETGLSNPLDDAILAAVAGVVPSAPKLAEIPFDFVRKRVSVVVEEQGGARLVTKGAFAHVLDACTRLTDGRSLDSSTRAALKAQYERWSRCGVRVLAVATGVLDARRAYTRDDESDLTFEGFVTFVDRPCADAAAAIRGLADLGVSIKLVTGDSGLVAQHVAATVGLRADRVLTGAALHAMSEDALLHAVERTDLFVEVDPNQNERIIHALRKVGHVVGFLGDGVNDAPAMHAADTSLSVDRAVDVAREAADFVLLERRLDVIRAGILAGRTTFANTLKYILTTTSANLGNMASMAAASLFLPFLPLLAGQILLNNFLSDVPAIGIAGDAVDPELVARPERWNVRFVGRFMGEFGLLSSLFDFLTFAVLLRVFRAGIELFRTAWFVESLLTELVIALVVRTRRSCFRSRPGTLLLASTIGVVALTFAIPYVPASRMFGFVPVPGPVLATLCAITVLYVAATESAKRWVFRSVP